MYRNHLRTICFIILVLTTTISCKREILQVSSNDHLFNYTGADPDIRKLVSNLKKIDDSIEFSRELKYAPLWEKAQKLTSISNIEKFGYVVPLVFDGENVSGSLEVADVNLLMRPTIQRVFETLPANKWIYSGNLKNAMKIFRRKGLPMEPWLVKDLDEKIQLDKVDYRKRFVELGDSMKRVLEHRVEQGPTTSFKYGQKKVTMSNSNQSSCSVWAGATYSGWTRGCTVEEAHSQVQQYMVNYIHGQLIGVEGVTSISFVPNQGIMITGDPTFIQMYTQHLLSLMQTAHNYVNMPCVGDFYLSNINISTSCDIFGGNQPGHSGPTDIRNKIQDICLKAAVQSLLDGNDNIHGEIANIIKKFDDSKTLNINIFDGTTSNGEAGQMFSSDFDGNVFNANIRLQTSYFKGANAASKESLAAVLIHEIMHAYIKSLNPAILTDMGVHHNSIADNYVIPMSEYLFRTFNITRDDAFSLAWNGVIDSQVFAGAQPEDNFVWNFVNEYGMPLGLSLSKQSIMNRAGAFNAMTNHGTEGVKGQKICEN